MTTLLQAKTALKARLDAYYAGQGVNVYAYVPGQISAPCVVVEPSEGEYHQVFGGQSAQTEHTLSVIPMIALGDRQSAEDMMSGFLSATGPTSIMAGIIADPYLTDGGGSVLHAEAMGYRDYGTKSYDNIDYLMCTVTVKVQAA